MPKTTIPNQTGQSLNMGRVALTVRDLDRVGDYYERIIGLSRLSRDGDIATYGAGDNVLLELRQDRLARQRSAKEAGLFHTAFLLPDRADLGRWISHAVAVKAPVTGVADHLVSEAVYLNDPEGNGIEIYTDRARSQWSWSNGEVAMSSDPLDIEDLIRAGGAGKWQGLPEASVVGHVHLQVGSLAGAEEFYTGRLGLNVTCHYPGAVFMAADGYHHHIAANIWNSRNAAPRDFPSTGLSEVALHVSPARAAKIRAQNGLSDTDGAAITLRDPWNTPLRLQVM